MLCTGDCYLIPATLSRTVMPECVGMPVDHEDCGEMQSGQVCKAEARKSNKPIMEKRRRARINHCLNDLKGLILEAMKKDPSRHSKLEKADILEMTVKHLQTVQSQQLAMAVATDPTVVQKFKNGFSQCASEVSRYVARIEGVDPGLRQRLLNHLNSCVTSVKSLTPMSFLAGLPGQAQGPPYSSITSSSSYSGEDVNNNPTRMLKSLQLVPSRLPSGELAFVLPGGSQIPSPLAPLFPPVAASSSTATPSSSLDHSKSSAFKPVPRLGSPVRDTLPPSPSSPVIQTRNLHSHILESSSNKGIVGDRFSWSKPLDYSTKPSGLAPGKMSTILCPKVRRLEPYRMDSHQSNDMWRPW